MVKAMQRESKRKEKDQQINHLWESSARSSGLGRGGSGPPAGRGIKQNLKSERGKAAQRWRMIVKSSKGAAIGEVLKVISQCKVPHLSCTIGYKWTFAGLQEPRALEANHHADDVAPEGMESTIKTTTFDLQTFSCQHQTLIWTFFSSHNHTLNYPPTCLNMFQLYPSCYKPLKTPRIVVAWFPSNECMLFSIESL